MQATHAAARHQLVGFLLGLCVLNGLTGLFAGARPGTIQAQLDVKMQLFWCVLLAGGALLAIVGIYWPGSNIKVALELESLGMTCLAVAAGVYAVAIILVVPLTGMSSWSVILTFALFCIARRQTIESVLKPDGRKRRRRGGRA